MRGFVGFCGFVGFWAAVVSFICTVMFITDGEPWSLVFSTAFACILSIFLLLSSLFSFYSEGAPSRVSTLVIGRVYNLGQPPPGVWVQDGKDYRFVEYYDVVDLSTSRVMRTSDNKLVSLARPECW